MPTFKSIGLHPELRSRLVTESTVLSTAGGTHVETSTSNDEKTCVRSMDGLDDNNNHDAGLSIRRHQPFQEQESSMVPVETPHGLLSRRPEALRLLVGDGKHGENGLVSSRALTVDQATKLRRDVAEALIAQSNSGKYVRRIQETVEKISGSNRDLHEANQPNDTSGDASCTAARIPGCVSALDLVRYEKAILDEEHREAQGKTVLAGDDGQGGSDCRESCLQLSTGCPALDKLLAFPRELTTAIMASTSSMNSSGNIEEGTSSTAPRGGIPFGHVTEIVGPPASGKTQLALEIVASAAADAMPFSSESSSSVNESIGDHGGMERIWYLCSHPASLKATSRRLVQLIHGHSGRAGLFPEQLQRLSSFFLHRTSFQSVSSEYELLAALATIRGTLMDLFLDRNGDSDENRDDTSNTQGHEGQAVKQSTRIWKPCLLVLDSLSGCLSSSGAEGTTKMWQTTIGLSLKRLAREFRMAIVVVTNDNDRRLAAGTTALGEGRSAGEIRGAPVRAPGATIRGRPRRTMPGLADVCVHLEPTTLLNMDQHINPSGNDQQPPQQSTATCQMLVVRATLERHPSKCCDEDIIDGDGRTDDGVRCCYFCLTPDGIRQVECSVESETS